MAEESGKRSRGDGAAPAGRRGTVGKGLAGEAGEHGGLSCCQHTRTLKPISLTSLCSDTGHGTSIRSPEMSLLCWPVLSPACYLFRAHRSRDSNSGSHVCIASASPLSHLFGLCGCPPDDACLEEDEMNLICFRWVGYWDSLTRDCKS